MELKYNLDITKDSQWLMITPHHNARDLLFYVSETGHFVAGQNFYTERTEKKEYYLIFTISGQGFLNHKNQTLLLDKNHAVLMYCDEYQYYKTNSKEPWNHYWVHFNGAGCKTYLDIINDSGINAIYIEDPEEFLKNIQNIMANAGLNDIRQSVMSSMYITNILTTLVLGKFSSKNVSKLQLHEDEIKIAIDYIKAHYAEPITLDDFVGVVHLSKYYFLKLFKYYTGMSPYEYIINFRINKAKKILRSTDIPITQVANSVGFLDECNFIKKFKKTTGTTPLNFRKHTF